MNNQPLVTVLMPVYNAGPYLDESIESVLGQTYPHFEYLIINDGSTDNTKKVVEDYILRNKENNQRTILLNQENRGKGAALNAGLEKAEGVVVTAVEPGSAADDGGIRRGDVILEVDRRSVRNLEDYKKAIAGVRKGRGVLFLVRRGESTLFLALKPQK